MTATTAATRSFAIQPDIQTRVNRTSSIILDIVRDANEFDRKCTDAHARAGLRMVLLTLGELLVKT